MPADARTKGSHYPLGSHGLLTSFSRLDNITNASLTRHCCLTTHANSPAGLVPRRSEHANICGSRFDSDSRYEKPQLTRITTHLRHSM